MKQLLHILMVEDSEDDVFLLLRQLKADDYQIIHERVDNATDMLRSLRAKAWDIVIADYILPGFGGLEALKLLQEHNPDLPCIIVSGKITDEIAVAAIKAGARDYVMKDNLGRLGIAIRRELSEADTRRKHRKAEEKVRQSAAQIHRLFSSMVEGAILWGPDLKVIKANAEARRIFRLSENELEGQPLNISIWSVKRHWDIIRLDGTAMPDEERAASLALKEKREIKNVESGLKWSDNTVTWINSNAAPILNEQGKVEGIINTFIDITEQKQLREEKDNFTRKLIEVQEEERKRIARELHDDTAQNLALLMLEVDSILINQPELPLKSLERLKKLKDDIDRTQRDVRRFSHELRPGVLEYLGLEPALEGLIEDVNDRIGARVSLNITGEVRRLSEDVDLILFRIAQEAINNIWRHAEATEAQIDLKYYPDKIKLTIADNGKGFKPVKNVTPGRKGGLGLIGMRERAQLIGANLKIKSTLGKGTLVSVEV